MKFIAKILVAVMLFACLQFPAFANTSSDDTSQHRTGAIQPSKEDTDWFNATAINDKTPKLNALGISRINSVGKGNKVDPKTAVSIGAEATSTGGVVAGTGTLPNTVDNSTLKYFPPIGDQGNQGSCASFSSTYYLMTYMTAMARNWDAKNGGDAYHFSPKWTYNQINGGSDDGSNDWAAMNLMMQDGAATCSEFPYYGYSTDYRAWPTDVNTWTDALNYRMDAIGTVTNLNTSAGLNTLKQYLNNGYILTYDTYIYSWQKTTIKNDPSTTNDDAAVGKHIYYWINGSSGGHSMTIVGYNDDIWCDVNNNGVVDPGEKGALRIANSWGTSWEDSGYTWLAYDALNSVSSVVGGPSSPNRQPALSNYQAYWMTAKTSYQPKLVGQFTVNTANRNEMFESLGFSDTNTSTPSDTYTPKALNGLGGAYAPDGTSTACDATFALDFTDLINKDGLGSLNNLKWYLGTLDNRFANSPVILKGFKLVDPSKKTTTTCTDSFPISVDGANVNDSATYALNSTGPTLSLYNDTNHAITYSYMSLSSNRGLGDFNDDTHYAMVNGGYFQFTFTGNGVEVLTEKYTDEGSMDIYIDGVFQTNVNCYNDTRLVQQTVYSNLGLSSGTHTIKGVKVDGTYVMVDALKTYVNAPPAPAVASCDPTNGATSVAINKTITITYNSTITAGTAFGDISLKTASGSVVASNTVLNGSTIVVTPTTALSYSTGYTVSIPASAVKNAGGLACVAYSFGFTTVAAPVPPVVATTDPANGATAVAVNKIITVNYDGALSAGSAWSSVTLTDSLGGTVTATKAISGNTVTITPSAPLGYLTAYTVSIPAGAVKGTNNAACVAYSFGFTTVAAPPVITSTDPVTGPTAVAINKTITVTYNGTLTAGSAWNSIALTNASAGTVAATIAINGSSVSITPTSALTYATGFTVSIPAGAVKNANNIPCAAYSFGFTTVPAPPPPVIASTDPLSGATTISLNKTITVTYDNTLTQGSAWNSIALTDSSGGTVATTTVVNGNTVTITPSAALSYATSYTVFIPANAVKNANNIPCAAYSFGFTTVADVTAPTVVSISPVTGASAISMTDPIHVTFSENIKAGVTFGGIKLEYATTIKGVTTYKLVSVSISISGNTMTIKPSTAMISNTTYRLTMPSGAVCDLSSNALASTFTSEFKTGQK